MTRIFASNVAPVIGSSTEPDVVGAFEGKTWGSEGIVGSSTGPRDRLGGVTNRFGGGSGNGGGPGNGGGGGGPRANAPGTPAETFRPAPRREAAPPGRPVRPPGPVF